MYLLAPSPSYKNFPMSEWETAGALTRYEWKPLLCALFSGTGSEEYWRYWNLLSDPLAGSKLGRENNTFARLCTITCINLLQQSYGTTWHSQAIVPSKPSSNKEYSVNQAETSDLLSAISLGQHLISLFLAWFRSGKLKRYILKSLFLCDWPQCLTSGCLHIWKVSQPY